MAWVFTHHVYDLKREHCTFSTYICVHKYNVIHWNRTRWHNSPGRQARICVQTKWLHFPNARFNTHPFTGTSRRSLPDTGTNSVLVYTKAYSGSLASANTTCSVDWVTSPNHRTNSAIVGGKRVKVDTNQHFHPDSQGKMASYIFVKMAMLKKVKMATSKSINI